MRYVFKKRNAAADPAVIERLAKEFGVGHLLAELLAVRGIVEDTGAFLNPDIRNMYDPHMFGGMKKAVEVIRRHIKAQSKICVFGDYDSDGVNAAVILYLTLKKMGGNAAVYLPRRAEGYGLSMNAVGKIAQSDAKLLITADCGISNVEEIAAAKEHGMDVVLTDHHECPAVLPGADAILNPKREGETYPFRELCGGGVVFKLACALIGKEAFELIDFAAVATIGDVVPLVGENRIIAAKGLYKLTMAPSPGLKYLMKEAGMNKRPVESEAVAFGLVPRINAAGRLEDPRAAFDLLCGEGSPEQLQDWARKLCALNLKRQGMQEGIVSQAMQMAEGYGGDRLFVLQSENWDPGIVGLAASALVERFCKPAILFGERDGMYVGSARSIDGVNIYNAVRACEDLLVVYGGHEAAAGMTVKKENLPALRKRLNSYLFEKYTNEDFLPTALYDMEANLADLGADVVRELAGLKPFGCENEPARILLKDVVVAQKTPVGNGKHSKLRLNQNGAFMGAVAFGKTASEIPGRMDALVSVQISDYSGAAEAVVEVMSFET